MMTAVCEQIKGMIGDDVEVNEVSVTKNNGVVLNGVTVKKIDLDIAPTIYRSEDEEDDEFIDKVVKIWNEQMSDDQSMNEIVTMGDLARKMSTDPEFILSRVKPVLVSRKKNMELFNDVYHDPFLDLEIIYKVFLSDNASITLKYDFIERTGLDTSQLYDRAMQNFAGRIHIESMSNVLAALMTGDFASIEDDSAPGMYVMSTDNRLFGAAAMLNDEAMKKVHILLDSENVIVLPSSVHEVIAIADTDETDYEYMLGMVREVNMTQVQDDEILSDSIYVSHMTEDGHIEWRYIGE